MFAESPDDLPQDHHDMISEINFGIQAARKDEDMYAHKHFLFKEAPV
jgi:hypothetical protein